MTTQQALARRTRTNRDRLDERGIRVAKYFARQMQMHALTKMENGFVPRISVELLQRQVPLLADLMLASNLAGRLDARKSAKRIDPKLTIALDISTDVFNKNIAEATHDLGNGLDLKSLEEKYNIVALRTLRNVADTTEREVRSTAFKLIEQGATVREAKKALSERFDAMGLTPRNSFQLETIYRTSSAVAYGAGNWESYKDPAIAEILWGFEYTAVDDDRTRENHAAANGVILPKDHEFWQRMWPPNGYNCRCEVIPVYDDPGEIVEPPSDAVADEGFGYNPGEVLGELDGGIVETQPEPEPEKTQKEFEFPEPEAIPEIDPAEAEQAAQAAAEAEKWKQYEKEKLAKSIAEYEAKEAAQKASHEKWLANYKAQLAAEEAAKAAHVAEMKAIADAWHAKKDAEEKAKIAAQLAALPPKEKRKYTKKNIDRISPGVYRASLTDIDFKKQERVRKWHRKMPKKTKELFEEWFRGSKPMQSLEQLINTGKSFGTNFDTYTGGKSDEQMAKTYRDWQTALDKGVKYGKKIDVYRGLKGVGGLDSERLWTTVGSEIDFTTTQSASRSTDKAGEFAYGYMLVKVKNAKGVVEVAPIGYSGEHEVLLRANTKYRVIEYEANVTHGQNQVKHYVTIEEIRSATHPEQPK